MICRISLNEPINSCFAMSQAVQFICLWTSWEFQIYRLWPRQVKLSVFSWGFTSNLDMPFPTIIETRVTKEFSDFLRSVHFFKYLDCWYIWFFFCVLHYYVRYRFNSTFTSRRLPVIPIPLLNIHTLSMDWNASILNSVLSTIQRAWHLEDDLKEHGFWNSTIMHSNSVFPTNSLSLDFFLC